MLVVVDHVELPNRQAVALVMVDHTVLHKSTDMKSVEVVVVFMVGRKRLELILVLNFQQVGITQMKC